MGAAVRPDRRWGIEGSASWGRHTAVFLTGRGHDVRDVCANRTPSRLALLYTLTDGKRKISAPHLTAALAVQDYAARSAACALTAATGDPLAEQIHTILRANRGGLAGSQISQTLNHNQPAGQIDHALDALHAAGRVTAAQIPTGGWPAQLWTATPPTGA